MDEAPQIVLTDQDKAQLNDLAGYLSFAHTKVFKKVVNSPCKLTCLFTGNQFGKTNSVAMDYVTRIMGTHPNPLKVIKPQDQYRTIRFASETIPMDGESEVKNTQYPAFKRWLPPSLIKKDITVRKPVMTIKSPLGGKDILVEFVGYDQDVEKMAGVQLRSVWFDENPGVSFYEEHLPRLMAATKPDQGTIGDMMMTYTPTPGSSGWEFDTLYDRANTIYRTPNVRRRILSRTGELLPPEEQKNGGGDIYVIMAATDDNPTLAPEAIEASMAGYDDQDVIDARRYGQFRQLSGRLFKGYNSNIHVINHEQYFPEGGPPHDWKHFRSIDCHAKTPWAIVWVSVSPQDEMFVWNELNPSPEKMVTNEIVERIAIRSGDYVFSANLIDPIAAAKQNNSGFSVMEDMNRLFFDLKREGIGTGGYWQGWDTKGEHGMDEIKRRLKNATVCGKPFNNKQVKDGREALLPTIWFTNRCSQTTLSFQNWRWEEWANRDQLLTKDEKNTPAQRWSHFCHAVECLAKDPRVSRRSYRQEPTRRHETPKYFSARA